LDLAAESRKTPKGLHFGFLLTPWKNEVLGAVVEVPHVLFYQLGDQPWRSACTTPWPLSFA